MSDFEEKLNAILSSPETMAQVMSIAQSLGMGDAEHAPDAAPRREEPAEHTPEDLLGGLDPALLTRLLPLLGKLGQEDGQQLRLLEALEPFLKAERREKLGRALRTARLITAGKELLSATGDAHV